MLMSSTLLRILISSVKHTHTWRGGSGARSKFVIYNLRLCKRIFRPNRKEVTGVKANYITRNLTTSTPPNNIRMRCASQAAQGHKNVFDFGLTGCDAMSSCK